MRQKGVSVERTCRLCGDDIVPLTQPSPLSVVMFYERVCRTCARVTFRREIPADIELTIMGDTMLDNAERVEIQETGIGSYSTV